MLTGGCVQTGEHLPDAAVLIMSCLCSALVCLVKVMSKCLFEAVKLVMSFLPLCNVVERKKALHLRGINVFFLIFNLHNYLCSKSPLI